MDKVTQHDDRKIYWIVDPQGGKGKTWLAGILVAHYGAIVVQGQARDVFHEWQGEPIVIFDISHSLSEKIDYSAMDSIKNGIVFSGKYDSKVTFYKQPEVLVFASCYPRRSAMSEDRWDITKI